MAGERIEVARQVATVANGVGTAPREATLDIGATPLAQGVAQFKRWEKDAGYPLRRMHSGKSFTFGQGRRVRALFRTLLPTRIGGYAGLMGCHVDEPSRAMPVDESVAEVASSAPAEAASSAPDASPAEVLLAGNLGEGKSGVLGALLQGIQAVPQQVKELGQKVLRAPARVPELF